MMSSTNRQRLGSVEAFQRYTVGGRQDAGLTIAMEFPDDDDMDQMIEMEEQINYEEEFMPDYEEEDLNQHENAAPSATNTAASVPLTAVGALNSLVATSSSSVPRKAKLSAHELALELQAMRKELGSNKDAGSQSFVQLSSEFVSKEPLYWRDLGSATVLHARPELNKAHVTCVLANGSRVFLRRRTLQAPPNARMPTGSLLSKSIVELLKEAKAIEVQVLAHKQQLEEDLREKELYGTNAPVGADLEESEDSLKGSDGQKLWVEKYAPKSFSQLLSSERVNRDVLKALKQWDAFVFKTGSVGGAAAAGGMGGVGGGAGGGGGGMGAGARNAQSHPQAPADEDPTADSGSDDDDEAVARRASKGKASGSGGGSGGGWAKGSRRSRPDLRPAQRIILLAGPPGTGKTTLAHVVARHCGYRPHEVNASDDRSAAVLRDTLSRAMHSNTVDFALTHSAPSSSSSSSSFSSSTSSSSSSSSASSAVGAGSKPNCIILDEIDGIDGRASIDALLAIVKAPLLHKGAGGHQPLALTRPLICVCNDQYAPALRDLRRLAMVFVFHPPAEVRLVTRLRNVCTWEGLPVPAPSLAALCAATGHDIRAAINTLQFAALRTRQAARAQSKSSTPATSAATSVATSSSASTSALSTASLGHTLSAMISSGLKDEQRDAFQVWRETLSQRDMVAALKKKRQRAAGGGYGTSASAATAAAGSGSSDTTHAHAQGQLTNPGHGPAMEAMCAAADLGDTQLVLSGLFENLALVRGPSDPQLAKAYCAAEWLSFADHLDFWTLSAVDGFQVVGYIPVVAGAVHLLCAGESAPRLQWPSRAREAHYRQQQQAHVLDEVVEAATAAGAGQAAASRRVLAVDSLHSLVGLARHALTAGTGSGSGSGAGVEGSSVMGRWQYYRPPASRTGPGQGPGQGPGAAGTGDDSLVPLAASDHQMLLDYFHRFGAGAAAGAGAGAGAGISTWGGTTDHDLSSSSVDNRVGGRLLHKPNPLALQSHSANHALSPTSASTSAGASTTADGSTSMDVHESSTDLGPGGFATAPAPAAPASSLPAAPPAETKKPAVGRMDLFFKAKINPKRAAEDAAAAAAVAAKRAKTGDTGPATTTATASAGATRKTVHKVVFKFNQGFSDAVRRPVTVGEFL